ncbi:hypothetical protein BEWA_049700 [Theileria equi strain WA]|uniref:Uncharacterized protein n=1 Tax=Theileria equi strain WA TaxID=1537102 RepID=L1LBF5_THEEQ|nr:hypothetical protein BEWA_049700 [Theileria equi strain WA]EKX72503.1 hypothetical protein BEWA_049700 [Theileria equi strain WA]|eukprot:XP_004831955.1 hypothetical protein BEWA_049700 [Theileria equi strain WA]
MVESTAPKHSVFKNGYESSMNSQKVLELTGRSFMFLRSIYNDDLSSFFCREMLVIQLNYLYLWFYEAFKDFPSDSYISIDDLEWDNLQKLGVEELFVLFLRFISRLESIQIKSLSTLDTMMYYAFENERIDTLNKLDKKTATDDGSKRSNTEKNTLDEALRSGYSLRNKEANYTSAYRLRFFNSIFSEFPEHEKIREQVKASLKASVIKGMFDIIDKHPELAPRDFKEKTNGGSNSRPISLYNCLHTMTYIDEFGNMYKVFSQIDKASTPINVSLFDYIDLWRISIDQKASKNGLVVQPTIQKDSSIEFLPKQIKFRNSPVSLVRHPNTITYSDEEGNKYTVFSKWENGSPLVDERLDKIYLMQSPQEPNIPNPHSDSGSSMDIISGSSSDISIDIADVESTALNFEFGFEGSHSNAKSMGISSKQVKLKRSMQSIQPVPNDSSMDVEQSKNRRTVFRNPHGATLLNFNHLKDVKSLPKCERGNKENGIHLYLRSDILTYSDGHGNIYKISRQLDTGFITIDDDRLNTIALWETMLPQMAKFDGNTTSNPYQGVCIFKCPSTWTYVDNFGQIYTIFKHINDPLK